MRNRVMHVQQIQRRFFGYFIHPGGKRQSVRRMIEEWVRCDFHFVEIDPLVSFAQSNGHGVADEMDFMAARSKFDTQLCRYDPGAAVSWIAGNSDFHKLSFDCSSPSSRRASYVSACASTLANARFTRLL